MFVYPLNSSDNIATMCRYLILMQQSSRGSTIFNSSAGASIECNRNAVTGSKSCSQETKPRQLRLMVMVYERGFSFIGVFKLNASHKMQFMMYHKIYLG